MGVSLFMETSICNPRMEDLSRFAVPKKYIEHMGISTFPQEPDLLMFGNESLEFGVAYRM